MTKPKKSVAVNETCIGCQLCVSMCPRVFEMNGSKSVIKKDAPMDDDMIDDAIESCPVYAISAEELDDDASAEEDSDDYQMAA
ncbi:ferredoxin [Candidatus Peregrinibacteria bacterium]|nr:MAG: ferredoxin [Candidatus Peregrinibacteria bacterium]